MMARTLPTEFGEDEFDNPENITFKKISNTDRESMSIFYLDSFKAKQKIPKEVQVQQKEESRSHWMHRLLQDSIRQLTTFLLLNILKSIRELSLQSNLLQDKVQKQKQPNSSDKASGSISPKFST